MNYIIYIDESASMELGTVNVRTFGNEVRELGAFNDWRNVGTELMPVLEDIEQHLPQTNRFIIMSDGIYDIEKSMDKLRWLRVQGYDIQFVNTRR